MAARDAPPPICMGFKPPRISVGAVPLLNVCDKVSEKDARPDLKAGVLILAILLPIVSRDNWLLLIPDTPENNDLIIVFRLLFPRKQTSLWKRLERNFAQAFCPKSLKLSSITLVEGGCMRPPLI
jgi:hypothetical protein